MTKDQRSEVLVHFSGPLTSRKLRNPNKDEWRSCINPRNQIWLDGVEVNGEDLKTYSRKNIVFFVYDWASGTERKPTVHLWTKKGHDEYLNKYKDGISESDLLKIRSMSSFTIGRSSTF